LGSQNSPLIDKSHYLKEGRNGATIFQFRIFLTGWALEFQVFEWGGQTFGPPCPRRRAKRQYEQSKPAMMSCHLAVLNPPQLFLLCERQQHFTPECTQMSALEEKNERRRGDGSAFDVKRITLPSNRTVKTSYATSSPSLPTLSPSCYHLCTSPPLLLLGSPLQHCGSLPHTPFFFSHTHFCIIFSESVLSIYFIFHQ
jgi:hypothetical protein